MKIELVEGLYFASARHEDGAICMGYSEKLGEAMMFCAELVLARDEK